MKKAKWFPLLLPALSPLLAAARPVAGAEAAVAAANWLARTPTPLGERIAAAPASEVDVRTALDENGEPVFHAVVFPGGGVVATSAETGVEPIIAFSDSDGVIASGSPLYAILAADIALRAGQVRNAGGKRRAVAPGAESAVSEAEAAWDSLLSVKRLGMAYVSDMRVTQLLETVWGQGDDRNGNRCANYYTPSGYVCGCVALAGAQIARYWRFPTASRPSVRRACYVSGRKGTYDSIGGTYSWDLMPDTFASPTAAQREAIGKLCYDFGVATHMDWGRNGSGTGGFCLDDAFTTVFGYANSRVYAGTYGGAFSQEKIGRTVFANLDAGCPVALGIDGHEVVADGYGYVSGKPYTHLNLGWDGDDNAWYGLPVVDGDTYQSTVLDEVVYNIFPDTTGDLLTGRVLDKTGKPVAGATVVAGDATATTGSKGIYALWVDGNAELTVVAKKDGLSASKRVYVTRCVSSRVSGETISANTGTPGNSWGNDIVLQGTVNPQSPDSLPVHRFYSEKYRGHFFTINIAERDELIKRNPNWRYEGFTFNAFTNVIPGTVALYRFHSRNYQGHFYTIDEAEKDNLIARNPNWRYEGVASYVYPDEVEGSVPVFRFWSKAYRHHFYTTNEAEKDNLIATNPNWKYEGIAFHALPADDSGNSANGAGRAAAAKTAANAGIADIADIADIAGNTGNAGNTDNTGNADNIGNTGSAGACAAAPWTLMLRRPCPGRVLAVPDVADLGEVAVETSDALAAPLAILAAAATVGADGADDAELRLALPDGVFTAQLWDGAGTLLEESEAEDVFDFALPANGVWRWLVVLDANGEEVSSIWLRASGDSP